MWDVGVSSQTPPEKRPVPVEVHYHKSCDFGRYSTPPAPKLRTDSDLITDVRKTKKII